MGIAWEATMIATMYHFSTVVEDSHDNRPLAHSLCHTLRYYEETGNPHQPPSHSTNEVNMIVVALTFILP